MNARNLVTHLAAIQEYVGLHCTHHFTAPATVANALTLVREWSERRIGACEIDPVAVVAELRVSTDARVLVRQRHPHYSYRWGEYQKNPTKHR